MNQCLFVVRKCLLERRYCLFRREKQILIYVIICIILEPNFSSSPLIIIDFLLLCTYRPSSELLFYFNSRYEDAYALSNVFRRDDAVFIFLLPLQATISPMNRPDESLLSYHTHSLSNFKHGNMLIDYLKTTSALTQFNLTPAQHYRRAGYQCF